MPTSLNARLKQLWRFNLAALSRSLYLLIVVLVAFLAFVSCLFLLSQAVRTAPNRNWTRNINVIVIGAAYVLVLVFSLAFCLKRRLSVRLKLARIPKRRIAVSKGDLPKRVHLFIEEQFLRSCAIAFASQAKTTFREGWGAPGTKYEGVRFRTAILDTVAPIDAAARAVIPSIPPLSPHVPLARHLRHILPLLSISGVSATHNTYTSNININLPDTEHNANNGNAGEEDDIDGPEVYFRRYAAAVEHAKYSERELTEEEFERAFEAAGALKEILNAYKVALDEHSTL